VPSTHPLSLQPVRTGNASWLGLLFPRNRYGLVLNRPSGETFPRVAHPVNVGLFDVPDVLPQNALQVGVAQVGVVELRPAQVRVAQVGIDQVRVLEICAFRACSRLDWLAGSWPISGWRIPDPRPASWRRVGPSLQGRPDADSRHAVGCLAGTRLPRSRRPTEHGSTFCRSPDSAK
jgi:hypothetical protein